MLTSCTIRFSFVFANRPESVLMSDDIRKEAPCFERLLDRTRFQMERVYSCHRKRMIRPLYHFRKYLTSATMLQIQITPRIEYCLFTWAGVAYSLLSIHDRVQKCLFSLADEEIYSTLRQLSQRKCCQTLTKLSVLLWQMIERVTFPCSLSTWVRQNIFTVANHANSLIVHLISSKFH